MTGIVASLRGSIAVSFCRLPHLAAIGLFVTLAAGNAFSDPPGSAPPSSPATVASSAPPSWVVDEGPHLETVTLAQALERSLASNPTILSATEEIRRAQAIVEEVRSPSLPTLSANGTYTRLDSDRVFQGHVVAGIDQLSANLTLTVPLIATQHWAQWSQSHDNVRTAQATAEDARRMIAGAVAHGYLSLTAQHRIVATFERAESNARAHLDFAHARYSGGIGNRIDEVRAAQEVATDQTQIATQRLTMFRMQEALGVLLGSNTPIDAVEDVPLPAVPALASALDDSQTRRSDVRIGESRLRATRHAQRDGWTDYMPTLNGVFQPFYQNPPTISQPQTGWQAFLILTVPLYDGGLRYGQEHERSALVAEARYALESISRQARSEVRAAFEEVRRADEAAVSAHEAARLAHEALALSELAYREGASTNIEVIDAQRRARDADAAANAADDGERQARLDVLLASGRFP